MGHIIRGQGMVEGIMEVYREIKFDNDIKRGRYTRIKKRPGTGAVHGL